MTAFSTDFKYFINYQNACDQEDDDDDDDEEKDQNAELCLTIHCIVSVRTSLMNLLIHSNIHSRYGEESSKAIIDMLTLS